ncbi:hydrogenase maturation nickel metallochaperone HypA [Bellilinea sp.]|jgi:hydrogenase nickel incorporation protein HypA/HybF|uniref:hydrogenase maturation nickel metallochaperone HypA n=1 Tax=Bellilinea sp. TaxID=2838785 RepID=UPI002ADD5830|nr:hydrogenase maturation nickel metallochaperone HypA [Bellilinea sp.]
MHELAVTESVLDIALRHAGQANASRVTDIYLVIGRFSSIVDDSVQFYWDMIAENTICQHATLHFKRVPGRMKCLECEKEFEVQQSLDPCPYCGSFHLNIIGGEEFYVESIIVEK